MVTSRIWYHGAAEGGSVGALEDRAECCGYLAGAGKEEQDRRCTDRLNSHLESGPDITNPAGLKCAIPGRCVRLKSSMAHARVQKSKISQQK